MDIEQLLLDDWMDRARSYIDPKNHPRIIRLVSWSTYHAQSGTIFGVWIEVNQKQSQRICWRNDRRSARNVFFFLFSEKVAFRNGKKSSFFQDESKFLECIKYVDIYFIIRYIYWWEDSYIIYHISQSSAPNQCNVIELHCCWRWIHEISKCSAFYKIDPGIS